MSNSSKHTAGILGGLGPQSTELFYREFIRHCQKRKPVEYPNLLINSINLWDFVGRLKDRQATIDLVNKEIAKIHDHVTFIASPCNTIHFIIEEMRAFSKVPILAIHEEVAKQVAKTRVKKVGILGTKTTIYGNFYQKELEKIGVAYEVLSKQEEGEFDERIFSKMLHGYELDEMRNLLLAHFKKMEEAGCDGVILACTELPLFVNQEDTDLTLFLSTNILAEAVHKRIFDVRL